MQAAARRNRELSLLILALIPACGALALAGLAVSRAAAMETVPLMAALAGAYCVAHVVVRQLAREADPLILPLAAILNGIGLAAVYRLSPDDFGPAQIIWTVVGLVIFCGTVVVVRDYKPLAHYKYVFGFAGVGLLLLPLTPLGTVINGARLWVGYGSFSFQPGELAKICIVIFFAAYLAERKELLAIASRRLLGFHVPDVKHFGPILVMWGLSLAVMFYETDLGSSLLFFSIFLVMLYIATARAFYLLAGGALFVIGAIVGYNVFGHVRDRVAIWLDPLAPSMVRDEAYQLAQSLFAFATGGMFGTGLGSGRPDLIPAAQTDFVFAVVGEELGLLGTSAVLLCFLLLVGCGLRIAMLERDDFGQLLAAGLTIIFALQTIIIIGGVTRVLPLTGITLPFMSYGGSSMLANFILLGLLVRISHQRAAAPEPAATSEILVGGRR